MLLDLPTAKQHLRVTVDDEDALITLYIGAAEGLAQRFLNRSVYPDETALEAADDPAGMLISEPFKIAVLLTLSDLYYNRGDANSAASSGVPPKAAQTFLQPDRIEMGT